MLKVICIILFSNVLLNSGIEPVNRGSTCNGVSVMEINTRDNTCRDWRWQNFERPLNTIDADAMGSHGPLKMRFVPLIFEACTC